MCPAVIVPSTKRKVSNPLALAVLALLLERSMHPYELAATLRQRGKSASIKLNYGSLYTVVAALQRAGFIEPRGTVRAGRRPERTVYTLTDEGRVELHDWMRELLSAPAKEYSQLEAGLALLPVLPPDEVVPLLEERLRRLDEEITRLESLVEDRLAQGLAWLVLVESDYHLAMLRTERQWVANLARSIREDASGVVRTWRAWHEVAR